MTPTWIQTTTVIPKMVNSFIEKVEALETEGPNSRAKVNR